MEQDCQTHHLHLWPKAGNAHRDPRDRRPPVPREHLCAERRRRVCLTSCSFPRLSPCSRNCSQQQGRGCLDPLRSLLKFQGPGFQAEPSPSGWSSSFSVGKIQLPVYKGAKAGGGRGKPFRRFQRRLRHQRALRKHVDELSRDESETRGLNFPWKTPRFHN